MPHSRDVPRLILVDELAHTNAPGSRHARRWQDVEGAARGGDRRLDDAQRPARREPERRRPRRHRRARARDGPRCLIERADEIELVDLSPEDLLKRLREGKVYVPEQAEWARTNFFRKGNLIALRELALRRTAQQVDAQMETYRHHEGIARPWPVRDRLLVCVGDPAEGVGLVRATRRLADALKTDWLVVHVETPGGIASSRERREYLTDVLSFAAEFGAETAIVTGLSVRDELLALAAARNVSRIVLGRTHRPAWRTRLFGSLTQELLRSSPVDIWVLQGERGASGGPVATAPGAARRPRWRPYVGAAGIVLAATLLNVPLQNALAPPNLVMIYLLGVVVSAVVFGRGPAILAAVLSVALFDLLFVPPRFTFSVNDTEYVITFAVLLLVGMMIGTLTARLREQLHAARVREGHTAALQRLSHEMAGRGARQDILSSALSRLEETFDARAAILLPGPDRVLAVAVGDAELFGGAVHERAVAQWAFDHQQEAGSARRDCPRHAASTRRSSSDRVRSASCP